MENKSFDHIIKSKLESFRLDPDSEKWIQFQAFMEDARFDDQVKKEVENHQLEVFPDDWSLLQDKIERLEHPEPFDEFIGSALAGAAIQGKSDWDDFEKILSNDEAFDHEISAKVKHHTVPSDATQWPKLSAHLEEMDKRRRRIFTTKLVEAAVFLLLIITLLKFLPLSQNHHEVFRTLAVEKELNQVKSPDIPENAEISTSALTSSNTSDNIIEEKAASSSEALFASSANNLPTDAEPEPMRYENMPVLIPSLELQAVPANFQGDKLIIVNDKNDPPLAEASSGLAGAVEQKMLQTTIPSTPVLSLNTALSHKNIIIPEQAVLGAKKGKYWLNFYGAPDLNFINTPYDHYYQFEAYQNQTAGYSAGISLSYETSSWEFESGLAYSGINYFPKPITELTGNFAEGFRETTLKEIILDIVHLPTNFKYIFFRKKGWTFYGSSGLSISLIANADYDIDQHHFSPLAASRRPDNTVELGPQNPRSGNTILNRKEFDPGLLNQGKWINNVFFTLDTGVGLSKKINDVSRFYIQPTYHYNLNISGIGPNNDFIHRLGVQIGTKIAI